MSSPLQERWGLEAGDGVFAPRKLGEAAEVCGVLGVGDPALEVIAADAVEKDDEVSVELWGHVGAGEDVSPSLDIGLTAPAAGGKRGVAGMVVTEGGGLHTEDDLGELVADDIWMERDGGLD